MDKEEILNQAKSWFRDTIAENHTKNTKKLINPNEFNINPFLSVYLANFLTGNSEPESIARALVLARTLGSSITTSFGANIQNFTAILLDAYGSTTQGIDIEFIDQIDGQKKYCQLKLGPNTINKDDVETIVGHFSNTIRLARTNGLRVPHDDLIVGVIYGETHELNGNYKRITNQYHHPVIVGKEFWHRLTGDEDFYFDILHAIASVATEADYSAELEEVIQELGKTESIKALSPEHRLKELE